MKSGFLFSILYGFLSILDAQEFKSALISKNINTDRFFIYVMKTDDSGYIYHAGLLEGKADISTDTATFNLQSNGKLDAYVAKYTPGGSLVWARNFGGADNDWIGKLCIENNGDIVITGTFSGAFNMFPGNSSSEITSKGFDDIYIMKLNRSGEFIWVKSVGNDRYDQVWAMDVSKNGMIMIGGNYNGNIDVDPGPGETEFIGTIKRNSYLLALDKEGNFQWAKNIEGDNNHIYDVCYDSKGNIYAAGSFAGKCFLSPGSKNDSSMAAGNSDAFMIKLNAGGTLVWKKVIKGSLSDEILVMDIGKDDKPVFGGSFNKSIVFAPNDSFISKDADDIFIAKCDENGNMIWNRHIGGTSINSIIDIEVDSGLHVWSSGRFYGLTDFDPGKPDYSLPNAGMSDGFLLKLNYMGEFTGVISISSEDQDACNDVEVAGSDVYFCGIIGNTILLKLAQSAQEITTNGLSIQSFIIRLSDYALKLNPIETAATYSLYPNPGNQQFYIHSNRFLTEPIQSVRLIDPSGRQVWVENCQPETDIINLDLNKLSNGRYLLECLNDTGYVIWRTFLVKGE